MIRTDVFEKAFRGSTAPQFYGCIFCEENNNYVVASSENFKVILDNSPLVEGHLMVTSKGHYGCLGEIPDDYLEELEDVICKAKQLVFATYGIRPYLYEHGRAGHCDISGNIFCHHFHLHLVPEMLSVETEIHRKYACIAAKSYADVPKLFERNGDYLLTESNLGQIRFFLLPQMSNHTY